MNRLQEALARVVLEVKKGNRKISDVELNGASLATDNPHTRAFGIRGDLSDNCAIVGRRIPVPWSWLGINFEK